MNILDNLLFNRFLFKKIHSDFKYIIVILLYKRIDCDNIYILIILKNNYFLIHNCYVCNLLVICYFILIENIIFIQNCNKMYFHVVNINYKFKLKLNKALTE